MWVKSTASGIPFIFAEGISSGSDPYYGLTLNGGYAGNYRNSSLGRCYGDQLINDGTWHHVVWTQTGSSGGLSIYTDGKPNTITCAEGSNDGGWFADTAGNQFAIGKLWRGAGGNQIYTGMLDDIRIYNYPLTATQVKLLYNGGSAVSF